MHATLLAARHIPECLCSGNVYSRRYNKCSTFTFTFYHFVWFLCVQSRHAVRISFRAVLARMSRAFFRAGSVMDMMIVTTEATRRRRCVVSDSVVS